MMFRMKKMWLFILLILFSGCFSYKVPFGQTSNSELPSKRTDIDSVLDREVECPNGYGLTKKGFHWGW